MQFPTSIEMDHVFWPFNEGADMDSQVLSEPFDFEAFDKDVEDLFRECPNLQAQNTSSSIPNIFPGITAPSSFTYSTESDSEPTRSQYSYDFAPSDYSALSDIVTGSPAEQNSTYNSTTYNSIYSDVISDDSVSFGTLPPSPPLRASKALSDHGTSNLDQSFLDASLEDLSLSFQQSANIVSPMPHPVQVMPDLRAYAAADRPFKCTVCSFASNRKYNLKTHIATHDKEKSKKFPCASCRRRFTRTNDLKRHYQTMHGNLKSSTSAYSGSAMPSGSAINIGVPMDFTAYYQGV